MISKFISPHIRSYQYNINNNEIKRNGYQIYEHYISMRKYNVNAINQYRNN